MRDLGQTQVSKGIAAVLLALFVLTIALVPLLQFGLQSGQQGWPQLGSLLTQVPTEESLRSYEDRLEDESVVGLAVLPPLQDLLLRVGVGNEQAYKGRDGFLFYRPAVDYLIGPAFAIDAPVQGIVDFQQQLAERQIQLVLLPTPGKAQLYPHMLAEGVEGSTAVLQNPSYAKLVARLSAAGLRIFDPSETLRQFRDSQGLAYLPTDTHWSPAAMAAVAQDLARYLQSEFSFSELPAWDSSLEPQELGAPGDLTAMLRLPDDQTQYPHEQLQLMQLQARAVEAPADVLLLGDSFSNVYSQAGMGMGQAAGLVEHLSHQLQRPLDRLVINAGGAHATRMALQQAMARGEDRLAGKKVLVWQFAMRELSHGKWQVITLPKVQASVPQASIDGPLRIRGRIQAQAPAPRPGVYRDCIVAMHLTGVQTEAVQVEAVQGEPVEFPADQALVYLWGMRDNKLKPVANWVVGQEVSLQVRAWKLMAADLDSFQRKDLDDEQLFMLPPYWGEDARLLK